MQLKLPGRQARLVWIAAIVIPTAAIAVWFRRPLLQVSGLVLGGAVLAFLFEPIAALFEHRLSRRAAALSAIASALIVSAALLWLALPALIRQLIQLAQAIPDAFRLLSGWAGAAAVWLEAHLPGLQLPKPDLNRLSDALSSVAAGTIQFAGSAGSGLSRFSLMLMLSYFFLSDRGRLLLRLELLVPQSFRQTAVRMGNAVCRELRLYLRGQLMIALAVGALAAAGLMLARVRSAAVLGGVVGILNMIPYFGPFIGGVPAVLIAMGDGWQKAVLALAVLAAVQQLDALLISPRIMGSLTGFSPAAVLLAIFAGARISGIGGMLIALPLLMSIRTVFRVFVQSHENI